MIVYRPGLNSSGAYLCLQVKTSTRYQIQTIANVSRLCQTSRITSPALMTGIAHNCEHVHNITAAMWTCAIYYRTPLETVVRSRSIDTLQLALVNLFTLLSSTGLPLSPSP